MKRSATVPCATHAPIARSSRWPSRRTVTVKGRSVMVTDSGPWASRSSSPGTVGGMGARFALAPPGLIRVFTETSQPFTVFFTGPGDGAPKLWP